MLSFKYIILVCMISSLATFNFIGCKMQRYTTKFEMTPIGSLEEETIDRGMTDPKRLTEDLDILLKSEDEKRRKMLQESAEEKKEKENKTSEKETKEIK